jgi:hypothetical protein
MLLQIVNMRRLAFLGILVLATRVDAAPIPFEPFPDNATHSAAAVAEAIANVPLNVGQVYDTDGVTDDDIQVYNFGTLVYTGPINISSTLQRIRDGDWIPTEPDDGGFFNFLPTDELYNIPRMGNDYYMEFVVWPSLDLTDGTYDPSVEAFGTVAFPGPMRLLIGMGGEVYFTGDHYGDGLQQDAYLVNPLPEPSGFVLLGISGMVILCAGRRRAIVR